MASKIKVDQIEGAGGTTVTVPSGQTLDVSSATVTLPNGAVSAAKLNADVISGQTELTSSPADTDELLVSDAGVLKRIDYSLIKGGGLQSVQVFTSSGTYTRPSGITKAKVIVTGGGGGGGGGNNNYNHGGGGGAGGTAIKFITSGLGSTETVTIGNGGSAGGGGQTGGAGQTSSFGSHCTGTGGSGGPEGQGNPSGAGGQGTGGDINIVGGMGHPAGGGANSNDETSAGNGGASFWGGGGAAANHSGGQNTSGDAGLVYGSGGGGGDDNNGSQTSGGAGMSGVVFVEEY
jgi:hypothetical protein